MGFRMVYELSDLDDKKFWSIFSIRWDLSQKKIISFAMIIYSPFESPCQIKSIYVVLKNENIQKV
jgi:hypothetical protein